MQTLTTTTPTHCGECGCAWPEEPARPKLAGGCRGCRSEYGRRWRSQNHERMQELQRRNYQENIDERRRESLDRYYASGRRYTKYGITEEDFLSLYVEQMGRCAICLDECDRDKIHIDHNHETGEVRGLLCGSCNRAIGYLKDNPLVVFRAFEYLSRKELNQ